MNIPAILTDVVIAFSAVFLAGMALFYVLKNEFTGFLNRGANREPAEDKHHDTILKEGQKEAQAVLLPLRLQAHERLIIFIERINPGNLLLRLHEPGMGMQELQSRIVDEIKSEYQHNITQQLYVEAGRWKAIRQLKEDTLAMMNNAAQTLPADAPAVDLSRAILQHMSTIPDNPYDITIDYLKSGIQQLF